MRISDWSSDVCSSDLRNRSASCRIPYVTNPKARRIEMRFPDPIQSGYLTFTALMMAGLDGIKNKIDPGSAMRSEEHTSELQSLMRISYAVFCLKKKQIKKKNR